MTARVVAPLERKEDGIRRGGWPAGRDDPKGCATVIASVWSSRSAPTTSASAGGNYARALEAAFRS